MDNAPKQLTEESIIADLASLEQKRPITPEGLSDITSGIEFKRLESQLTHLLDQTITIKSLPLSTRINGLIDIVTSERVKKVGW